MRTEAIDRVDLIFSLLDANANGQIEADDFALMAHRVNEAAGDADQAARDAMLAAFRRYWSTLAELDADGDGKLSRDEYRTCVLSPERFAATLDEFARSLAALGDPDGDGFVERRDFAALMTAIGFAPAGIDATFEALGAEDGRLAVTAWTEGIRDYYAPDKAGIAGDALVPPAAG